MTKKKKKHITVRAPSKPVTAPEKKAEKATKKALEEERFGVLEISRKLGTYFGVSVLAGGCLLLCLFAYVTVTGQTNWMATSPELAFLGFVLWIFVGIINIIGGFLLMGS
jgi:formate/nitrite transporter FocA (FNT family)